MRHQIAGVENAEQESMESQPTRLLLIVVVVSDHQHGLCELKL